MAMPASFSANRLSLVDRGFAYAIAHVRGGSDKGWGWYLDGKTTRKTNTFALCHGNSKRSMSRKMPASITVRSP